MRLNMPRIEIPPIVIPEANDLVQEISELQIRRMQLVLDASDLLRKMNLYRSSYDIKLIEKWLKEFVNRLGG